MDGPIAVYSIGADLGGTKVSAALIDDDGIVLRSSYLPHDGTIEGAIQSIVTVVGDFADASPQPTRVGVAAAGLIDRKNGDLVDSALLGVKTFPLGRHLAALLQMNVIVENDANATLLGVHPSCAGTDTAILIALGTGVGGAVSIGGRLVEGANGFAAEIGHIAVEQPGRHPCPCGSSGCLELFASGTAVAAAAARRGQHEMNGARWSAVDVVGAAAQGDALALQILEEAGTAVGQALVGLIAAFDPAVVYISGGFGHAAAPYLLPAIADRVRAQRSFPAARPLPEIIADPVGPLAAAIGAARLAQRDQTTTTTVHERCSNEL